VLVCKGEVDEVIDGDTDDDGERERLMGPRGMPKRCSSPMVTTIMLATLSSAA